MREEKSLQYKHDWTVLLIGGISGTGKTMVARRLGLHLGLPWLQVDDLRLALQRSRVTLSKGTEALYFFLETPDAWRMPPERLRDQLIAVGEVMSPAIEVVVESHIDTAAPIIIEGDGILPSLLARPEVQKRAPNEHIRVVFLIEPDEEEVFANIVRRGRGTIGRSEEELRIEARTKWLYGQWLAEEAHRFHLPVIEARPWNSLVERILAAVIQ